MKFFSREIYDLIPWAREKLKDGQFLKIKLERPEASSNKQVTLQAKENAHMAQLFSLLLFKNGRVGVVIKVGSISVAR